MCNIHVTFQLNEHLEKYADITDQYTQHISVTHLVKDKPKTVHSRIYAVRHKKKNIGKMHIFHTILYNKRGETRRNRPRYQTVSYISGKSRCQSEEAHRGTTVVYALRHYLQCTILRHCFIVHYIYTLLYSTMKAGLNQTLT